jgi:hypothetical protein
MHRRDLFVLFGLAAGASVATRGEARVEASALQPAPAQIPFEPVPLPLPLPGDGRPAAEQQRQLRRVSLEDRLVVPPGYRADLLAAWGDPLGDGRFGFNNDHLAFTPLGEGRALLTVNFEYISPRGWSEGYGEATGTALPWAELSAALRPRGGSVEAMSLAADDPLLQLVRVSIRIR